MTDEGMCECPDPEHDCKTYVTQDGVVMSPRLCTACLFGCMP